MKRSFILIAAASAAILTVSCSNELRPSARTVTLVAEGAPLTRTQVSSESTSGAVDIWWTAGDRLGVFGTTTSNSPFSTDITSPVGTAAFSGEMNSGDAPVGAYYPYSIICNSASDVRVGIAAVQTYEGLGSIAANDIKVCSDIFTSTATGYTTKFRSLTSLLRIRIDLSGLDYISDGDSFRSLTLTSEGGRVLTGEFSLNASDPDADLSPVDGGTSSSLVVEVPDADISGAFTAYANIYPGFREGDAIDVLVCTDDWNISFEITALKDFRAGYCYDIPLDVSKATVAANNLSWGALRQALWDRGMTFDLGGTSFSKSSSGLGELLLESDTTVDDASLENTIVFLSDGVTLTLGSSATLGNTVIVNNDENGASSVTASSAVDVTAGNVALWDVDVDMQMSSSQALDAVVFEQCSFDGLSSALFDAGTTGSVSRIVMDGCDWKVSSASAAILDGCSRTSSAISSLVVTGNVVHSSSASAIRTMEWVTNGSGLSFSEIKVDDNMLLNIGSVSSGLVGVASAGSLEADRNMLYYGAGASLSSDVVICSTASAATDVECLSSWYSAASTSAEFHPYVCGSTACDAANPSESPLSAVNIPEGTFAYSYLPVAVYSQFDGSLAEWSADRASKTFSQLHSPDATEYSVYMMPGVTMTADGSAPSVSVRFTGGGLVETWDLAWSDYVDASSVQTVSGIDGNWNLVWADEFNGSAWDGNAWTRCPAGTPNWAQEQWPSDESLAQLSGTGYLETWGKAADSGEGYNGYKTGGIWGKDLKSFNLGMDGVSGRIDVRARMTDAKGYWPAIWMMPQQSSFTWPQYGEIDLMEHLNYETKYYATLHTSQGTSSDHSCSNTASFTDRTSWHVFSVIVNDGTIYLLLDGSVVTSCSQSDHGISDSSSTADKIEYWPYGVTEYYLILDSQLNGGWVGQADGTDIPAHMDIDYVRYMVKAD